MKLPNQFSSRASQIPSAPPTRNFASMVALKIWSDSKRTVCALAFARTFAQSLGVSLAPGSSTAGTFIGKSAASSKGDSKIRGYAYIIKLKGIPAFQPEKALRISLHDSICATLIGCPLSGDVRLPKLLGANSRRLLRRQV